MIPIHLLYKWFCVSDHLSLRLFLSIIYLYIYELLWIFTFSFESTNLGKCWYNLYQISLQNTTNIYQDISSQQKLFFVLLFHASKIFTIEKVNAFHLYVIVQYSCSIRAIRSGDGQPRLQKSFWVQSDERRSRISSFFSQQPSSYF